MNPIIRFYQNAVAPTLTAMVLITAATSAHAIVVNIDPNQSSVTYTPGFLFPTYRGILNGQAFTVSDDSCSFSPWGVLQRAIAG